MPLSDRFASSRRSSCSGGKSGTKSQQSASSTSPVLATSPQSQFDLAVTLLRHQLQQQQTRMTSPRSDVTRSATESLLLAALELAVPAAGGQGSASDGPWTPVAVTGLTPDSRRYKTELCRAFEERGQCRYGERCQFAHGVDELRALQRHPKYKTELCRTYHTSGFCPYGSRCHFVHNGSTPPAPPPTPRDVDSRHLSAGSVTGRSIPDGIQLSLISAALEKQAALAPTTALSVQPEMTVSSGTSTTKALDDVITSTVVASILQRRRPQATLTLDPAPRASPPAPGGPSRRSSASMDSGYGNSLAASPTFPVVDVFTPPPPLPLPFGAAVRTNGGPRTAPLLPVAGDRFCSQDWFNADPDSLQHPHPGYSDPGNVPPGLPRPAETSLTTSAFKYDPYFVFDGFVLRQ